MTTMELSLNVTAASQVSGQWNWTRRRVKLTGFSLVVSALSVAFASAATYYVATTGSDSAAGSITAPFRTIGHGVSALSSGDRLYIRGGTYHEQISVSGANQVVGDTNRCRLRSSHCHRSCGI